MNTSETDLRELKGKGLHYISLKDVNPTAMSEITEGCYKVYQQGKYIQLCLIERFTDATVQSSIIGEIEKGMSVDRVNWLFGRVSLANRRARDYVHDKKKYLMQKFGLEKFVLPSFLDDAF